MCDFCVTQHLFHESKDDESSERSDSESKPKDKDQASGTQKSGEGCEDSDTEANAEYVSTIRNLHDASDIDLTSSSQFEKCKDGLYINHTCPDTPDCFLVLSTPLKACKPPEEGEVTLRSLPVEIFITLMTIIQNIRKGVNWLEHGVNTRNTRQTCRKSRSGQSQTKSGDDRCAWAAH